VNIVMMAKVGLLFNFELFINDCAINVLFHDWYSHALLGV
jgi:hypothetical protein